MITNRKGREETKELGVGRRIDSEHMPLEVNLGEITQEDIMKMREIEVVDWTIKVIEEYRKKSKT